MSVNKTQARKPNKDGFEPGSLVTTEQLYEYERKQRRAASEKQATEAPKADAS